MTTKLQAKTQLGHRCPPNEVPFLVHRPLALSTTDQQTDFPDAGENCKAVCRIDIRACARGPELLNSQLIFIGPRWTRKRASDYKNPGKSHYHIVIPMQNIYKSGEFTIRD